MYEIRKPDLIPDKNADVIVMTVPELTEYLGIGRNLAYSLLKTEAIKGFRIGSNWRVKSGRR